MFSYVEGRKSICDRTVSAAEIGQLVRFTSVVRITLGLQLVLLFTYNFTWGVVVPNPYVDRAFQP